MTTTTYPTLNQPVSPPAENSLAHAGSGTDKLRQEKWRIRIGRILFAIGLIAVWELGSRYVFDPFWSGQPSLVADRLITMVSNGDLWWHLVPTVIQALAGLLLSLLVGVPLGILFAINKTVEKIIEPFFLGSTAFRALHSRRSLFSGSGSDPLQKSSWPFPLSCSS